MKRTIFGSLLLAAVACLALPAMAASGVFDAPTLAGLVASPADLATGALLATAAAGVPLADERSIVAVRAKLQVGHVQEHFRTDGTKSQETVNMHAVAASKYPEDGSDEDNTYAKWSPGASLSINIANPALFGYFKFGDKHYLDFTKAPA